MSDSQDPKDILDAMEDMLEERKTKGDRRKGSQPIAEERRSGDDRRNLDDDESDNTT